MRYLLFILFTIVIFGCSNGKSELQRDNDLKKKNLKGKVKTIKTVRIFKPYEDKVIRSESFETFNENGNTIEYIDNARKTTMKYSSNGNIIEERIFELDDSKATGKAENKYDKNGNKIERLYYMENKSDLNNNKIDGFLLDKNNNLIEPSSIKSKIELQQRWTMLYDNLGNLIEENGYDVDGINNSKSVYKYNNSNKKIEESIYKPDCRIIDVKVTYKYDVNGNQIEQVSRGNEALTKNYYKYDDKSNEVKIIEQEFTINYDNNGNEVEIPQSESITDIRYEFDKTGNWVKKTLFIPKRSSSFIILENREIEYYK